MSYRNPFEALGLDKEDAAVEALRADLAGILRDWIAQRQLTQAAAGRALGVSQGVVSEIMNGQTGRKSIEYFIRLLARVGVAWTARCWHAPADASAVKGAAPADWIGVGGAAAHRSVFQVTADRAENYAQLVGDFTVRTHGTGATPVPPVVTEGAKGG